MSKVKSKVLAFLLVMVISLGSFGVNASAVSVKENSLGTTNISLDSDGRLYPSLKSVWNKNLGSYSRFNVIVGERTLSVGGFVANGVAYIPCRAASSATSGSNYNYTS
jgi:hypothetical protein